MIVTFRVNDTDTKKTKKPEVKHKAKERDEKETKKVPFFFSIFFVRSVFVFIMFFFLLLFYYFLFQNHFLCVLIN